MCIEHYTSSESLIMSRELKEAMKTVPYISFSVVLLKNSLLRKAYTSGARALSVKN